MTDEQFKITFGWSGFCSACSDALSTLPEISFQYFEFGSVQCSKCGAAIDLWQTAVVAARKIDFEVFLLVPMGANLTAFSFSLESNETKTIDFSEYGVPSSAVILSVLYTPDGSACFPVANSGSDHANNLKLQ